MKKNASFLLILFAFVLLLGGAYVLYDDLSQGNTPDQLSVIYGQNTERPGANQGNTTESANTADVVENTSDPNTTSDSQETPDADAASDSRETSDADAASDSRETSDADAASDSRETSDAARTPAPDFTVYDLAGNEVFLSDYFGKPIVLNFWASWCGPCQSEMPDFNEAYAELGEEIHFLMVNLTAGRETLESASSFIEKNAYSFPVFYDMELEAATAYGAYSLPTTFFIDSEGYIIAQATGAISMETLLRGIDMVY